MYFDRTGFHFVQQKNAAQTTESLAQVASFKCNLQPANGESTALINGQYGRVYTAFTTYSGLNIGDSITLSGTPTVSGSYYNVRAVRDYHYGVLPHFEVTITLPEI